ncbi:Gfo/Idh/MocA family protein [Halomarina salina]|uniref:Gfo/Idh/MocA family protein n=1 Tax=Halomarina salina TaxID=1872699 RepID=A0ABD5RIK2_9EURY|nr:Gfo/Idh/MocA family oxidoreductase [Halomarina salina]
MVSVVRDDGIRVEAESSAADLSLGVVGTTPGNGHPYSFASIVNGYSDAGFAESEWDGIHDYLREKSPAEFGFEGVHVTHAWTQDRAETDRLCAAARVPTPVDSLEELHGEVDALLLLRDDYERHAEMALPFLEDGTPVFVDKPLALDAGELDRFRPHLESGRLVSCSGMRFARELDDPRATLAESGEVRVARGTVVNDWEHYGVHMLDAVFGVLDQRPVRVSPFDVPHDAFAVELDGGTLVEVDALGDGPFVFDVGFYGDGGHSTHELRDNFTAFRRTLWAFLHTVHTGDPVVDPEDTLDVMRTLIAGRRARETGEPVALADLGI